MVDRLTPLDASFLYLEDDATPMHVGGVAVFASPESPIDTSRLSELVEGRLNLVPRYRQRVRQLPGGLSTPVWVDDENFDLSYHVRRTALPKPGSDAQLHELVARVLSRPLDRSRPLWEMYLVEGLAGDRIALITKTHQALVDGIAAIEIGEVLFDDEPNPDDGDASGREVWRPSRGPSTIELLGGAVGEVIHRPNALFEMARHGLADVSRSLGRLGSAAGSALHMASAVARTAPSSPLNVDIGQARRFATTVAPLEDFRRIRAHYDANVHDVVLATVTGGLRSWLQMRGEAVTGRSSVRALVPMSVDDHDVTSSVASVIVELPVGEPSPAMRLHQVTYAMRAALADRRTVRAQRLAGLAGFAPATLHAAGARLAAGLSHRMFNLLVTNAPGPQSARFLSGARLLEAYPVAPLSKGQALSVGITSYDGKVFFGLFGDRDAMPDLDVLGQCLQEALEELMETVDL
ncbi:MAG TPA: wax ester/triacylglycerol synthase family O-acyltransferase [Actinomycetes bacterium]|nr:wax ester/triacylglycerol synthase family O-acyltransferase [Actinomycetes bacterium]